jgi:hypothetical protein
MRIISTNSVLCCDHKIGIVSNRPSQHFVRIDGALILIGDDPVRKPIAGCPNAGPTIKPCTSTMNIESGKSSLVHINGTPVCMDTVSGGTDGTPPMATKYKVAVPGQNFVNVEK